MKYVLVTGSNGQLGREFRKLAGLHPDFHFIFTDIDELDITDSTAVKQFFKQNAIDVCINCAAYTAVDKAEDDPEKADLLNHLAVKFLAENCNLNNTLLIQISTDYVFDGKKNQPYHESDPLTPLGIYAKSKLNGEIVALEIAKRVLIIRTSWLYSDSGHNFVKTILRLLKEKKEINVVYDQIGTPTNATDLAGAIIKIMEQASDKPVKTIYHYSNEGVASWFDFAIAIQQLTNSDCKIIPIPSDNYPTRAQRPFYSVLDKSKIKRDFLIEIPYWRVSLEKTIFELLNK